MANPKITAELLLELNAQGVAKELEEAMTSGVKQARTKVQRTISGLFEEASYAGIAAGVKNNADAVKSVFAGGVFKAAQEYDKLLAKIEKLEEAAQKRKLTREEQAQMKRLKREAAAAEKVLSQKAKAAKAEAELMRNAAKTQQDRFMRGADQMKRMAGQAQRMSSGDIGDLAEMARGAGGSLQKGGQRITGKAESLHKGGKIGGKTMKMMSGAGRALASFGAALGAVAAAVGAVVVLVKAFAALEKRIKDMNKALIGTAGAADFGFSHAEFMSGKFSDSIDKMRKATVGFDKNFSKFRATAKQQQAVFGAMQQGGYTYAKMNEEIAKGASHMKSFTDVTALAITYSRNLGVSMTEVGAKMGEYTLETGLGMQDIAEQFSVIQREATLAGHTTKRFYATIVEVTSGMAFYGVRIDETAKLLKTFDSLLGETVGAEAFKKVIGQYKEKGGQDRIRELILKSPQYAQEQFAKAYQRQLRNLEGTQGKKLGISGDQISKILGMDEISMSRELQKLGAGPEAIQEFRRARMVGQAAQGGMGAMTRAMPFAGAGFDVAMAANATQVFGGRRIDEVLRDLGSGERGAVGVTALSEVTGKSIDELEKLGAAFTDMEAAMANMREVMAKAPEERTKADKDLMTKYAKELGLFIDDVNKTIVKGEADERGELMAGTAVEIKSALDAVTETTKRGDDAVKQQLTKDQEIASKISEKVTGVSEVLEQLTNNILERIYNVVDAFFKMFASDRGKAQAYAGVKAANDALKKKEQDVKDAREKQGDAEDKVAAAKATGDEDKIKKAEAERDRLQKELEKKKEEEKRAKLVADAQANMSYEDRRGMGAGSKATLDMMRAGGVDISGGRAKYFASGIEQAMDRPGKDFGYKEGQELSFEAFSDEALANLRADFRGGLTQSSEEALAEQLTEQLAEKGITGQVRGGAQTVAEAMEVGKKAYKDTGVSWYSLPETKATAEEAFRAAVAQHLAGQMRTDEEQRAYDQGPDPQMMNDFMKAISAEGLEGAMKFFQQADDLIIPSGGGRPIITNSADTLMAFKPGGPISDALGGRSGTANVNINIYGGDQKKIYDTTIRVLKAVGLA